MMTQSLRQEGSSWKWGNNRGVWSLSTWGADTYGLYLTPAFSSQKCIISAVVLRSEEEIREFISKIPEDIQSDRVEMKWWERG